MTHPGRISFIGMMGAGKSTIGRGVAKSLGWPFADSDAEIEKAAGMDIPDIFADYGEDEFRRLEARVIARLLEDKPLVLATGGGAVVDADTRRLLWEKSLVVWLDVPLDVLVQRTERRPRPLLEGRDRKAVLADLLEARRALYEAAHLRISRGDRGIRPAIETVLEALPRDWKPEGY